MPVEQTQLFNVGLDKNVFAKNILDDLNKIDTIWKGTFEIDCIELEKWEHIAEKDKVLMITYTSNIIREYGSENNFTYWCKYKDSEEKLYNIYEYSKTLKRYENDKDLSVAITPDLIFVFFHKFERKNWNVRS